MLWLGGAGSKFSFLRRRSIRKGQWVRAVEARVKSFGGSHIWWTAAGSARLPSR